VRSRQDLQAVEDWAVESLRNHMPESRQQKEKKIAFEKNLLQLKKLLCGSRGL
jgi:hypothetical protein